MNISTRKLGASSPAYRKYDCIAASPTTHDTLPVGGRTLSAAVVVSVDDFAQEVVSETVRTLGSLTMVSDIILVGDGVPVVIDLPESNPWVRLRFISSRSSRLQSLETELHELDSKLVPSGSGRFLWYALGYLLSVSDADVIAVCEADYAAQPGHVEALLSPLVSPWSSFQICKSVSSQGLEGDLEAALLGPLGDALAEVFGHHDYLQKLIPFLYPAGGGLAFRRELCTGLRLPQTHDASLALLCELQHDLSLSALCQVQVAGVADGTDPKSLIALLLGNLRAEGAVLTASALQTLKLNFQEKALDCLTARRSNCAVNGVAFNDHEAEVCISEFAETLYSVGCDLANGNRNLPTLASWKRAVHALPDLPHRVMSAIEDDFAELSQPRVPTPPLEQSQFTARP